MVRLMREHLVAKVAVVLILIVGIGFAVPTLLGLRHQVDVMTGMNQRAASALAKGLTAGVRNAMLTGSALSARDMIGEARGTIPGLEIRIYAPNGEEVFAHRAEPPPPESVPEHVRKVIATKSPEPGPNGSMASPVEHAPRCKDCHDEDPVRGVLTLGLKGAPVDLGVGDAAPEVLTKVVRAAFMQLMTADRTKKIEPFLSELSGGDSPVLSVAAVNGKGEVVLGDDELPPVGDALRTALSTLEPVTLRLGAAAGASTDETPSPAARPGKGKAKAKNKKAAAAEVVTSQIVRIVPMKNGKRCHACHEPGPKVRGALIVAYDPEKLARPQVALADVIDVGLEHVMLSGLGRLIRGYLDAVKETEAVTLLTLHDAKGRLYKDAFTQPQPPPLVATAMSERQPQREVLTMEGAEHLLYVEPLANEERCQRCHGGDQEVRGAVVIELDTSEALRGRVRTAELGFSFGIVTVLAVLVLLVAGLRSLVLRPVALIGDVADRVAGGNLDAKAEVRSGDEIGRLALRINQMVLELKKKLALSRFVSKSAITSIDESAGVLSRRGERKRMVVLFSDVRGFTKFSESREPEEVVDMLNSYLHVQAEQVHVQHGDIDKFVGDELMAHFQGAGMEGRAVLCGVAMLEAVARLNQERGAAMAVGVGINVGEVVHGAMGAENRMDFTVIGDAVNLGARLCSAAAAGQVLVSEAVHDGAGELPGIVWTPLEPISVKGKSEPIRIFAASRKA